MSTTRTGRTITSVEEDDVDQSPVSLAQVTALGAAVVVVAVIYKGLAAATRLALRELDYRAGDPDTWMGRLR